MRGRAIQRARFQPPGFIRRQRLRREAFARRELGDGVSIHAALEPAHAEHHGARRVRTHQECRRTLAAQGIVDECGNRCAIARPGKSMLQPPVLERFGRWPALRVDIRHHLNGGRKPCRRCHPSASMMRTAKMIHMISSTMAPIRNIVKRARRLFEETWTNACRMRVTTNIHDMMTNSRSACLKI